jgi:hypothetical protein
MLGCGIVCSPKYILSAGMLWPVPQHGHHTASFKSRSDAFVAALGRRLAKGPKLRQEISENVQ